MAASIETAYLALDGWLPSTCLFDTGDVHSNAGSVLDADHKLTLGAELARGIDTPGSTDDDWRLVYTLVGRH